MTAKCLQTKDENSSNKL